MDENKRLKKENESLHSRLDRLERMMESREVKVCLSLIRGHSPRFAYSLVSLYPLLFQTEQRDTEAGSAALGSAAFISGPQQREQTATPATTVNMDDQRQRFL